MPTIHPKRTSRIRMRMCATDKQLLLAAANISHKNVAEFSLEAGVNEARHALANQVHFEISVKQWQSFCTALNAPIRQKPKLKALLLNPDS